MDPAVAADDTNAPNDDESIAIPKGENLDPEFDDVEQALVDYDDQPEAEGGQEEEEEEPEAEDAEYKVLRGLQRLWCGAVGCGAGGGDS